MVLLVGKDTLKISEAYINAFPAFSCPLFASKIPIVCRKYLPGESVQHCLACPVPETPCVWILLANLIYPFPNYSLLGAAKQL